MAKFIIFGFVSPKLSRCESSSDVRHTAKAIGPPTHLSVHIMTPTIIHVLSIITKSTPIIFLPNWKIEIWFLAPLRRAIAFVPFHCTVWPRWEIEDSQTFHNETFQLWTFHIWTTGRLTFWTFHIIHRHTPGWTGLGKLLAPQRGRRGQGSLGTPI